jgi:LPXTG-site transpeptidase (sortase) family protein
MLRGLVRVVPGLALVAVLTACGGSAGTIDPIGGGHERIEFNSPAAKEFEENPVSQSTEPAEESEASNTAGLYSIAIPSLELEAPVVPIASENRVLVPPHDPGVVGWWSEGAEVGADTGSAILVGHSVRTGGGVFDDVDQLEPGETVDVGGLTYEITSVETLAQDELPSRAEELFDQSVSGRVVIVTCNDWDGSRWQSNTVAIAVPA